MDDIPSEIIEQALEQAVALCDLDAPRAEMWASDLISMVLESSGSDSVVALLSVLDSTPGNPALVAAASVRSVAPPLQEVDPAVEFMLNDGRDAGIPNWVLALGTSSCDGAWMVTNRRGVSAVFRFVDSLDASHALAIDLEPGSPETIGDVTVGPGDLIDLFDDPDTDIEAGPTDAATLARRVAFAMSANKRPRESLVINGHLLASRLSTLVAHRWVAPETPVDHVPDPPLRDPDDDAFAVDLLSRALDLPSTPVPSEIGVAADRLRVAARADLPLARWLAVSRGPVDLDEKDDRVVLAALAAVVAPSRMDPLDADDREAVATLEWADWLGVVIGLVREGPGASMSPSHLVDLVNSCPEVASNIPAGDRLRVERALAVCCRLWNDLGVSDGDRLTEVGAWALPRALHYAWSAEFGD